MPMRSRTARHRAEESDARGHSSFEYSGIDYRISISRVAGLGENAT
jgi:hypothetical protein